MCTSLCSQGLLRIILLEAQRLIAKDNMMGGMVKGKSDPYAKISVGEFTFKSNVIKENLNPVWNEMYEVCKKAAVSSNRVKPFLLTSWTFSLGGAETWIRTGASESRAFWQRYGQRWLPGQVIKFSIGVASGGFIGLSLCSPDLLCFQHDRVNISVGDIINSQYTDQVSIS